MSDLQKFALICAAIIALGLILLVAINAMCHMAKTTTRSPDKIQSTAGNVEHRYNTEHVGPYTAIPEIVQPAARPVSTQRKKSTRPTIRTLSLPTSDPSSCPDGSKSPRLSGGGLFARISNRARSSFEYASSSSIMI
eukprot:CAMPEP_0183361564 /NCGR_PEP_ID=MMETSP0164_2-20130417/62176_1 /TAXON_ID=221442 /ORGANISM="Coccolithus pelagicus ssp braarudi, Strain PLY182g" /LENGTH=136 /DNA_ID=CAMNT_0025536189 /DNA_START=44 /DNA_END=454 /DNA_ORIENTATION=-